MDLPSLRTFPNDGPRVETGPVRFGDDWPGLFIRGDNAIMFASSLRSMLTHLRNMPEVLPKLFLDVQIAAGLLSDLESCIVQPKEQL